MKASGGMAVTAGGSGAGGAPALWPWVAMVRSLDAAAAPADEKGVDPGSVATAFLVRKPPEPPKLPEAAWITKPPEDEDSASTTH
jgi:hypothetical protein